MKDIRKTALLAAGLMILAAAIGCDGNRPHPRGPRGPVTHNTAKDGVLLRYQFPTDQVLRYDTKFRMSSSGRSRVDERLRAVIYQHSLGPADGGPGSKFHKLAITRREIQRNKNETDSRRGKLPPVIATRTVVPDITPNVGYDRKRNRYYFPVNTRGMFGLSNEAPYHRVIYDSLIYLLPVLPPGKVRRGSSWSVDIPVYAGADYFYPAGKFRRGNDFNLTMNGRVRSIYSRGGDTFADISWTCAGIFDTQAYNERFPPRFHNRQRIIHEVQGEGRAVFNVTRGVLVSRNGKATITFTSRILMSRKREGKPPTFKWEESKDRHILHYDCRLLGEREQDPRPKGL